MKLLRYIVVSSLLLAACKKENEHLPPNWNYKIPQVDIQQNVNVGAYYYNHSATNWGTTADTSALGQYNSLDPAVMSQQSEWADQAGVDFFVFNWNGAADNDLLESFVNGRSGNVKMVINYNTNHLKASNGSPLTGTKLTTMITEFQTLTSDYFDKDYYFKINGKPVVLITPLNLPSSASASIDYTTVMPELKSAGIDVYTIGEVTSGWLPPQRYSAAIQAIDAVTLSDWSTDVYDRAAMIAPYMDINWKNWTDSTSKWQKDFVPNIFPGYNAKETSPSSKKYTIDRTAELYTDFTNVAKRNMSNNRLVLINSWNNYKLATEIEPSTEYNEAYLDITRKQFKVD